MRCKVKKGMTPASKKKGLDGALY